MNGGYLWGLIIVAAGALWWTTDRYVYVDKNYVQLDNAFYGGKIDFAFYGTDSIHTGRRYVRGNPYRIRIWGKDLKKHMSFVRIIKIVGKRELNIDKRFDFTKNEYGMHSNHGPDMNIVLPEEDFEMHAVFFANYARDTLIIRFEQRTRRGIRSAILSHLSAM